MDVLVPSVADVCTTAVMLTPAEYSALSNSPLQLTLEQGAMVSAAILGLWGLAYGFAELSRVLRDDGVSSNSTE